MNEEKNVFITTVNILSSNFSYKLITQNSSCKKLHYIQSTYNSTKVKLARAALTNIDIKYVINIFINCKKYFIGDKKFFCSQFIHRVVK